MDSRINQLFDNLDKWRHLPAYQLERRADPFFSVYLPDILEAKYGRPCRVLIPEFPIHLPTIDAKIHANLSFKMDYLAVLEKPMGLVFVELKTDPKSRREKQDLYLTRAQEIGMARLITGLKRIYSATSSTDKYDSLLRELSSAGVLVLKAKGKFEPVTDLPHPEILYIQPTNGTSADNIISFIKVAELIVQIGDPLSMRFAQSLQEWAAITPGERN
jgi:hypothetical protein